MAQVKFTPNLQRFFPDLCECSVDATTVADIVSAVDQRWRGLGDYIVDEQGALRKHVNIFVGGELLRDKQTPLRQRLRRYPNLHRSSFIRGLVLCECLVAAQSTS